MEKRHFIELILWAKTNNRNFLSHIKVCIKLLEKTAFLMVKAFHWHLRMRQRYLLSSFLFNIVIEILTNSIRQEKKVQWLERKELLFTDMNVFIENPKEYITYQFFFSSIFFHYFPQEPLRYFAPNHYPCPHEILI